MIELRTGPRRARLVTLLAVVLAVVTGGWWLPPAASAAEPVTLEVTRIGIVDGTLTAAGTVSNTGAVPLTDVRARLWRAPWTPLADPEALREAVAAPTAPAGTTASVSSTDVHLLTGAGTLAPGESAPFTLTGDAARLGLTQLGATYWTGVDVTGRQARRASGTLATQRSLTLLPAGDVPVATVVDLSERPRQLKTDLFVDDGLTAELTDGRLAALLGVVETRGTDWYLDPSLLAEVRDMADGYRVQTATGSEPGTGQQAARAWLDRLLALDASRGSLGLPGSPDLATAATLGDTSLLDHATAASAGLRLPDARPVVLLHRPDAESAALVSPLKRPVIALDSDAPRTHTRLGAVDVLAASRPLTVMPGAALADTPANRRAVEVASAALAGGQLRWVHDPADLAADGPTPGVRDATLSELLGAEPAPWTPPLRGEVASPVSPETLPRIAQLATTLAEYGDVAPTAGVAEVADLQAARAASLTWLTDPEARTGWLDGIMRRLALPETTPVSVSAPGRMVMTDSTNEFPVTVTNHLTDPVTVRVPVTTDNPQRIRFPRVIEATVAPGASSTVLVGAEALGSGVVQASVHAESRAGRRLTPDIGIVVETTNVGAIGWVLVIASGIVLVVSTALRIRRVRGRRSAIHAGVEPLREGAEASEPGPSEERA